jgi:CheY-like chemotaxis protein
LVDDEKKFAMVLAKRLTLRGIETEYVNSAPAAIEMIKSSSFEVAVLDVKMPGISGIELRRTLSELDPHLKFVFLTGHGSKSDFEVGSVEAENYLPKPVEIEDLIEVLQTLTQ